ncbi:hypothetical protein BGX33_009869 [Mortierella sp. NVP41]|nr:hypothetical protein BGX33_009869 [Mortierella sp. NVP41]
MAFNFIINVFSRPFSTCKEAATIIGQTNLLALAKELPKLRGRVNRAEEEDRAKEEKTRKEEEKKARAAKKENDDNMVEDDDDDGKESEESLNNEDGDLNEASLNRK